MKPRRASVLTPVPCLLAVLLLSCAAAPAAAAECREVPGLAPLLEPGAVLLLGEIHGTEEAPGFLASVACAALAKGLPVTVGLEIDRAEDAAFQAFMASDGSDAARTALLASPTWTRKEQYGLGSRAMLGLVDRLRELAAGPGELRLVLIDRPHPPAERDRAMAERLAEAAEARPGDLLVVLTGNLHNRLTQGTPWNAELEPMGHQLTRLRPDTRIVSLDMAHPGGTAWVCFPGPPQDCGVKELGGPEDAAGRTGIELLEDPAGKPFSGRYFTGPITASEPALAP